MEQNTGMCQYSTLGLQMAAGTLAQSKGEYRKEKTSEDSEN